MSSSHALWASRSTDVPEFNGSAANLMAMSLQTHLALHQCWNCDSVVTRPSGRWRRRVQMTGDGAPLLAGWCRDCRGVRDDIPVCSLRT
eukprot:551825-Rhodomonas_salina.2